MKRLSNSVKGILLVAVAGLLLTGDVARGQAPGDATKSAINVRCRVLDADTNKPTTPATEYQIFGGRCSRSWQLQGTYKTAAEACWAAARFRSDKLRVEVTTGTKGVDPRVLRASSYAVYRNPCKFWDYVATASTREKANTLAEAERRAGNGAEIIVNYTAK